MRYATYTLRIEKTADVFRLTAYENESLQHALSHAEDTVNDALPWGFYCKIDEDGMGVVRKIAEGEDVPC